MTHRKTLLFVLLLLFVSSITGVVSAQQKGDNYLKEDFERYGWWETTGSDPVKWETKWTRWTGQTTPQVSDNSWYTWGPNRARWYRTGLTDTTVFGAFATRRTNFHQVPPSNYESTYVAGVHTYMQTDFTYKPTPNPMNLKFVFFANLLANYGTKKVDSFYVAVKEKILPDQKANWKFLYFYSKAETNDTISGTEKWFGVDIKSLGDTLKKYWTAQKLLTLRFGFISYNNPEKVGADSTRSPRAYGVWVDNVDLYETNQMDLFVDYVKFMTLASQEITDPSLCEKLKPWVKAGAQNIDASLYPVTFRYIFTVYNGTNVVLTKDLYRTQTSPTDLYWNPLGTLPTDLYDFMAITTKNAKFKLELRTVSGSPDFDPTNNIKEVSFLLKHIEWTPFVVDNAFNDKYFPTPVNAKVYQILKKNLSPDTLGLKSLLVEKYYNLDGRKPLPLGNGNTDTLTQVWTGLTRTNGFNLSTVYFGYEVVGAWFLKYNEALGYDQMMTTDPNGKDVLPIVQQVLVPETGWEILYRHKGFKEYDTKSFLNFKIVDKKYDNTKPELNTRLGAYLVKVNLVVYQKNRYDGSLVSKCSTTEPVYLLVPRDYQLVPVQNYQTFNALPSGVKNFVHDVNVWRFNEHNKKVIMHFYGGTEFSEFGAPGGQGFIANYTAALKENPPVPTMTPRPRITKTVDTVTFSRTVVNNSPTTAPVDFNRVVLYGYDGDILADAYYYFQVVKPQPCTFSLYVEPPVKTVNKGQCTSYQVIISRSSNCSTLPVTFNKSGVTSNPAEPTLSYKYSLNGTTWQDEVTTTAQYVYLQVCTQSTTPIKSYVLTLTGTSPGLNPVTTQCTLIVTDVYNNWLGTFRIREWNTASATDSFFIGMHQKGAKGLDQGYPTLPWSYSYQNESPRALPVDPMLFAINFKLDTTVTTYSKNETKPLDEHIGDPSTVYNGIITGRWPFLISYQPSNINLKFKTITVVDKFTGGNVYTATITYDANNNNWVGLPLINDWALNGYWYVEFRVKYTQAPGNPTDVEPEVVTPKQFTLDQNYPNPFNPSTIISYSLPKEEYVKLIVVNSIGETVATLVDGMQAAGKKTVSFNASNLPSGIYFYKINAGSFVETRKMMLVK